MQQRRISSIKVYIIKQYNKCACIFRHDIFTLQIYEQRMLHVHVKTLTCAKQLHFSEINSIYQGKCFYQ